MGNPLTVGRRTATLHPVRSSRRWVEYFRANAQSQLEIPWHLGTAGATPAELATIAASLRGWQLGETSDGAHLLAAARRYAAATDDDAYVRAVELFILEEQRHGGNLGRFLDSANIPRTRSDWGDTLFRAVRYCVPDMEVWSTPVVMVETHAMVYYNALRRATGSVVLRQVCRQILSDEVPHIEFQCERLARIHRARPPRFRKATRAFHRLFFATITLAVWAGHRRVLRAGGYGFRKFWRTSWGRMALAWRLMDPAGYAWDAPGADPHASRPAPLRTAA